MRFVDRDSDTDIVVQQQYEKKRKRERERERETKTKTMTMTKRKKEKEVRVPPELKVLKLKGIDMDMNAEDLIERYYFPNSPLESWYFEEQFGIKLDQPLVVDRRPPAPSSPLMGSNSQTAKDQMVLHALERYERAASDYLRKDPNFNYDATTIKVGDSVDIKSLFGDNYLVRRKGKAKEKDVVVNSLSGNYVMVCCCYAPALSGSNLWMVVQGCSEMYSKLYGKFEMVVVIKAKPGWGHPRAREKDVFRRTFSAFPPSCLAVPFHDREHRHNICSSAGLIDDPKVLLVGPDGKVLLNVDLGVWPLRRYPFVPLDVVNGSDSTPFPFIKRKRSLQHQHFSSFKGLLFHSCEFVFRKKMMPMPTGGDVSFIKEEVSLSDLNSKPIALYLYYSGEKLPLLRYIAQGRSNKDLEVVVVSLHTYQRSPSFPEDFSTALAKRGLPWWVVPYNFSTSILLDKIFKVTLTDWERVIIIGPNDQYMDFRGLHFMQLYGVGAHPFTFQSVVQKIVQELSQVTLDTFFELLEIREEDYPSPGTKALLYFDFPQSISMSVFKEAVRLLSYEKVQLHSFSLVDDESFKRHAMNLDPKHTAPFDFTLALVWHTKGFDKMNNFFLRLFNSTFPTIVAFGEDGRICSLLAHKLPHSDGLEPEIKGNLLEEVSSILEKFLKTFDRKENNDDSPVHGHALLQELGQTHLS